MQFKKVDNEKFDISVALDMIQEVFDMDLADLLDKLVISEKDFEIISSNEEIPKEIYEKIYNYAYNNGLYINDIRWLEEYEQLEDGNLLLSHGSRVNIRGDIRLDMADEINDFSKGFYCGQSLKQAGMFVSQEPNSSLYIVKFSPDDLSVKRFNVSTDWMLAVAYYRQTLGDLANKSKVKDLIDEIESVDYVVAPIADNRMFQIIDAFTDGQITNVQCQHALSATHLGYQFVFKKQPCLDHLEILDHLYLCSAEKNKYNNTNQSESNTSLNKANISRKKFANSGVYIDELFS